MRLRERQDVPADGNYRITIFRRAQVQGSEVNDIVVHLRRVSYENKGAVFGKKFDKGWGIGGYLYRSDASPRSTGLSYLFGRSGHEFRFSSQALQEQPVRDVIALLPRDVREEIEAGPANRDWQWDEDGWLVREYRVVSETDSRLLHDNLRTIGRAIQEGRLRGDTDDISLALARQAPKLPRTITIPDDLVAFVEPSQEQQGLFVVGTGFLKEGKIVPSVTGSMKTHALGQSGRATISLSSRPLFYGAFRVDQDFG